MAEPKWHPILQAREYEPGKWVMHDTMNRPYALIDFVRRGDQLGYRVDAWKQIPGERNTIGYFRSLHGAAARAHTAWVNRGVPHGSPHGNTTWPERSDPWD